MSIVFIRFKTTSYIGNGAYYGHTCTSTSELMSLLFSVTAGKFFVVKDKLANANELTLSVCKAAFNDLQTYTERRNVPAINCFLNTRKKKRL